MTYLLISTSILELRHTFTDKVHYQRGGRQIANGWSKLEM